MAEEKPSAPYDKGKFPEEGSFPCPCCFSATVRRGEHMRPTPFGFALLCGEMKWDGAQANRNWLFELADESESESEASDVNTSDEEDSSWISWFCTLKVGLRANVRPGHITRDTSQASRSCNDA
eukprot:931050-Prorocentrum_minimum.AAC.2